MDLPNPSIIRVLANICQTHFAKYYAQYYNYHFNINSSSLVIANGSKYLGLLSYTCKFTAVQNACKISGVYATFVGVPHPVYDSCCVQVFDSTQHLVQQVRQPLVIQLHLNHLAEVGIHQLHHQIPRGKQLNIQVHKHTEMLILLLLCLPHNPLGMICPVSFLAPLRQTHTQHPPWS